MRKYNFKTVERIDRRKAVAMYHFGLDVLFIPCKLNPENNFYPVALDGWEDRRDANKEITEIKQFLIACAGLGLVECSPGWCTGYNDYNGTIQAIKAAIKEMRSELKTIPTWLQYERGVQYGY